MADDLDAPGPQASLISWPPNGLLGDAALRVLSEADYAVQSFRVEGIAEPILVADDPYSTLGVITASTWGSLSAQIDSIQMIFANWAIERSGPGKRWDLYLVVLLSSDIEPEELTRVEAVVSDIRYVRKIVRGGVTASIAGVRHALAPFLPVAPSIRPDIEDPLHDLETQLRGQGIEPSVASFAIESFRETGEAALP
jgi:hypothetical protein